MKIEIPGNSSSLTKAQKILLVLFKLSGGKKEMIRFEDIAVSAYKLFREDFQLRGYPQYPDTGDIIHKPLYSELKKKGLVLSGNKYFSLTGKGIDYAGTLIRELKKQQGRESQREKRVSQRFTASQKKELERISRSEAFNLFAERKGDEILDIDFYSYLGVTVRTNKYDFMGRLSVVEDAIEATKGKNLKLYKKLEKCHEFLLRKFRSEVDYFKENKGKTVK